MMMRRCEFGTITLLPDFLELFDVIVGQGGQPLTRLTVRPFFDAPTFSLYLDFRSFEVCGSA